jgi:hypothetical protein
MIIPARSFAPTRLLLLFGLLASVLGHAQTLLVELNFDSGNLTQTGTAGTTFSSAQGNVTFGSGVNGGTAAVFDGATSLQAGDSPVTTALTVSFWMKTTLDNGMTGTAWFQGAGLVDGELGGDTTDWGISQMGTQVAFGIGSSDRTIFSSTNVNTGDWIHVAATWDTSGTMILYLNGNLEATDGLASTEPRGTINPFFIGQDLGGNTYTGSLDEIRIYDSALSAGQVAALAAIPEPATYAMFAGLAALGLAFVRRPKSAA